MGQGLRFSGNIAMGCAMNVTQEKFGGGVAITSTGTSKRWWLAYIISLNVV